MSILYTLVARDESVLCEYTEHSGNFQLTSRNILKHFCEQCCEPSAQTVHTEVDYLFYFLKDEGIIFMCMTERNVHTNVAYQFLGEVKAHFFAKYGEGQRKSALAYALAAFSSELHALMKRYDNSIIQSPMSQVRQRMDKVKTIMIDNVKQLMERGEKIDVLVMRTEKLQHEAIKYEKAAKKVKNVYWWKNFRLHIILAFSCCLLIAVMAFSACGMSFSGCEDRLQSRGEHLLKDLDDKYRHHLNSTSP
uniref:Vesicleassociated membrane protein putative n=1 Tax=Albugo laibachii Nc14 TaxID=890382 RepID=F0WJZ1_9STRA|nr:vesicleassociated membrane protein putative [Albugo laibachii Nc14]|eukprot:CCA21593.1 vesicleassociated membrane protein putative [Albugo laibachii Nc14]